MYNIENWFLLGNPIQIILLVTAYLAFVLKIGPYLMKDRPPFKLKGVLAVYNLFQVLFSIYMTYEGSKFGLKYGILGSECLTADDALATRLQIMGYIYFSAKVIELADTVFFVLRKKQNQITFLHVFHHTMMLIFVYETLKYDLSDAYVYSATLNSMVHIIMYTYYGLSAIPEVSKYLWWKKYITTIQLIQFISIVIHLLIYDMVAMCPTSRFQIVFLLSLNIAFLVMFSMFYRNRYKKGTTNKKVDN